MIEREQVNFSKSADKFLKDPEKSLEDFSERLDHDLGTEVDRIIVEVPMIGEGKAAKVFPLDRTESPCMLCAKIARHKPLGSEAELSLYQHIGIENRDKEPVDEFDLQDDLWSKGFRSIPCPIAYVEAADRKIIVMEEIPGYTLEQIAAAQCKIVKPGWQQLALLINKLHERGVIHRDLKTANIMLRTDQPLVQGGEISGELVIIDFGRAKYYGGTEPEPSDYVERVGDYKIEHANDKNMVEALRPTISNGSPFSKAR